MTITIDHNCTYQHVSVIDVPSRLFKPTCGGVELFCQPQSNLIEDSRVNEQLFIPLRLVGVMEIVQHKGRQPKNIKDVGPLAQRILA